MTSDMPNHLKYVMLGLATLADGQTGIIRDKSTSYLARYLGIELRQFKRYLSELENLQAIHRDPPTKADSLRGAKTAYTLTLPSGADTTSASGAPTTTPSGVQVPEPSGVYTTQINKRINRVAAPPEGRGKGRKSSDDEARKLTCRACGKAGRECGGMTNPDNPHVPDDVCSRCGGNDYEMMFNDDGSYNVTCHRCDPVSLAAGRVSA